MESKRTLDEQATATFVMEVLDKPTVIIPKEEYELLLRKAEALDIVEEAGIYWEDLMDEDLDDILNKPSVILTWTRHNALLKAEAELDLLNAGGVDNWIGYGECFEEDIDD